MEYNYLGSSGLKISNICLGTMTMGRGPNSPASNTDEADSHAILDHFVSLGGNFIDTADVYNDGKSEEIVGSWLAKQDRDSLVIATKVRFPTGKGPNGVGLSRKHILAGVEASLKRLQTPYIDLLQVHCWDAGTPLEETMRAISDLVRAGKVHYFGVSNFVGWQLQKIIDLSRELHLPSPVSIQAQYSLLCRWTEWELTPVCENEGVAMLPWSPLKGGWLTGKFEREVAPPADSRVAFAEEKKVKLQSHPTYSQYAGDDKVWELIDALKQVATETGRSPAQVAIRWLLQQPSVPAVVIGARKLEQLDDNCKAAAGSPLSEAQMQLLADKSAVDIPYPYEMVARCQNGRHRK